MKIFLISLLFISELRPAYAAIHDMSQVSREDLLDDDLLVLLENARFPCLCHVFSYDSHPIQIETNKKYPITFLLLTDSARDILSFSPHVCICFLTYCLVYFSCDFHLTLLFRRMPLSLNVPTMKLDIKPYRHHRIIFPAIYM